MKAQFPILAPLGSQACELLVILDPFCLCFIKLILRENDEIKL